MRTRQAIINGNQLGRFPQNVTIFTDFSLGSSGDQGQSKSTVKRVFLQSMSGLFSIVSAYQSLVEGEQGNNSMMNDGDGNCFPTNSKEIILILCQANNIQLLKLSTNA